MSAVGRERWKYGEKGTAVAYGELWQWQRCWFVTYREVSCALSSALVTLVTWCSLRELWGVHSVLTQTCPTPIPSTRSCLCWGPVLSPPWMSDIPGPHPTVPIHPAHPSVPVESKPWGSAQRKSLEKHSLRCNVEIWNRKIKQSLQCFLHSFCRPHFLLLCHSPGKYKRNSFLSHKKWDYSKSPSVFSYLLW